MARVSRERQDGFRDAFACYATLYIRSDYNFKIDALQHQLQGLLKPWNSSIEQIRQSTSGHYGCYRFVYPVAVPGPDCTAQKILDKMNEMEDRIEEANRVLKAKAWLAAPIMECNTDH